MTDPSSNGLLARLPADALARLAPRLEPVELPLGLLLEAPGRPIGHVVFPSTGVVSLVVREPRGTGMEAGLLGREGMTGLPLILGDDRSPLEARVQATGAGHRLPAEALAEAMEDAGARRVLLRWVQAFGAQVAHTVLANGRRTIEVRLARWLLMCQDRVQGDRLDVTHEFMSQMLGVRRAGVTVALHLLEGQGLVRARRGHLQVIDRAGLEALADGTYGAPEAEYARLLGPEVGG